MPLSSPIQSLDGVLLIDKPSGCTSHDVVDRLRRKLKMKRIGHAGTLDPMATGLLILLLGRATKLSQYLMSASKEYEGTFKLGEETNTQDKEGEILVTQPVPTLTLAQVESCAQTFMGDQYQIPPMFSAKKQDGVPLYKLARKGQEVEREPRFIHISKFNILSFESPFIGFSLACSKGTYVRTIAHDFGKKLGCSAHLTSLHRTVAGRFKIEQAVSLEKFEEMNITDIRKLLIPSCNAVPDFIS